MGGWSQGTFSHTSFCRAGKRTRKQARRANWDLYRKSSDAPWWQPISLKGLWDQCHSLLSDPSCEPVHCPHSTQLMRTILQGVPCTVTIYTAFPAPLCFYSQVPWLVFLHSHLILQPWCLSLLLCTTLFLLDIDPEKPQLQLPPQLSRPALGPCSLGHALSWLPSTLPVQLGRRQHKALADGLRASSKTLWQLVNRMALLCLQVDPSLVQKHTMHLTGITPMMYSVLLTMEISRAKEWERSNDSWTKRLDFLNPTVLQQLDHLWVKPTLSEVRLDTPPELSVHFSKEYPRKSLHLHQQQNHVYSSYYQQGIKLSNLGLKHIP